MEIVIQDFFEEHLKQTGVKYRRGFRTEGGIIDFIADFNGKTHGIEIKSSYSNACTAIGQLIGFSKYFSHLILVSTKDFLKKFEEARGETGALKQIGVITFENGNFNEIRKPSPGSYFFKGARGCKKTGQKEGRTRAGAIAGGRFTEDEEKFFSDFKNEPFMVCDVTNCLKKKSVSAYRFVLTLRRMGLIEEVNRGGYPKVFKATNKLYEIIEAPKASKSRDT
jgi:Holliday junction resolvase-like predicted endonuclease